VVQRLTEDSPCRPLESDIVLVAQEELGGAQRGDWASVSPMIQRRRRFLHYPVVVSDECSTAPVLVTSSSTVADRISKYSVAAAAAAAAAAGASRKQQPQSYLSALQTSQFRYQACTSTAHSYRDPLALALALALDKKHSLTRSLAHSLVDPLPAAH
jgi:hypothetical protein